MTIDDIAGDFRARLPEARCMAWNECLGGGDERRTPQDSGRIDWKSHSHRADSNRRPAVYKTAAAQR